MVLISVSAGSAPCLGLVYHLCVLQQEPRHAQSVAEGSPANARCPHVTSPLSLGDIATLSRQCRGSSARRLCHPWLLSWLAQQRGAHGIFGGPRARGGIDGGQGSPRCFPRYTASTGSSRPGAAVLCLGQAHGNSPASSIQIRGQGTLLQDRGVAQGAWGRLGKGPPPCARSCASRRALHMPVNFTPSALDGSLVIFGEPSHKFVPPHCSKLLSRDGRAPLPSTAGARAPRPRQGRGNPGCAPAAAPVTGGDVFGGAVTWFFRL